MSTTTLPYKPPRILDGAAITIAGYGDRFTQANATNIPALWARFGANYARVPHSVYGPAYGVCSNVGPDCSFDYIAGTEVTATEGLPQEFTHIHLDPQRYAAFERDENIARIKDVITAVHTDWLREAGCTPTDAPQLEVYRESFDPATGNGGFEIWVPIQA